MTGGRVRYDRRALLFVLLAMSLLMIPGAPVSAARPDRLEPDTIDRVRAVMEPDERVAWDAQLADPRVIPVAYHGEWLRVSADGDGAARLAPVRVVRASVATGFAIDDTQPAERAGGIEPAMTGGYGDMYMSITVNRDTRYGQYVWLIGSYVSVPRSASVFTGVGDTYNGTKDMIANGWAGGLALYLDGFSGKYYRPTSVNPGPLDINRSDIVPNAAVAYMFHEWARTACGPQGLYSCQMNWAQTWQDVKEATYKGEDVNVIMKYVHTAANTISPDITVGGTGPGISIGVGPASGIDWSYAIFESFRH
jgi:hypothetical protein